MFVMSRLQFTVTAYFNILSFLDIFFSASECYGGQWRRGETTWQRIVQVDDGTLTNVQLGDGPGTRKGR